MTVSAIAQLKQRRLQLETQIIMGNDVQIIAARALFRHSLVELHDLGYWREHPDQFKIQMRLYRASAKMPFNPPVSKSAPDKRARCSP